jgi:short-subunit dehydrogenase
VSRHCLDIADAEAVAALPDQVLMSHDRVNLLINNAGVGLMGSFEQLTLEEFEWLFNINFWGVVRTSKAFLPVLARQPDAHLVNISSVFGLIAPVDQTAYAASKFAVRGFTDALRHEMEGTSVGVSVVHPGGIRTRIAHNARRAAFCDAERADRLADRFVREVKTTPETAARCIVDGIERRSPRILIGRDASVIDWLSRLAPVGYWRMLKKLFEAEDHALAPAKTLTERKGLSHE